MKTLIQILIEFVLPVAIVYLIFSLIAWNLNILEWPLWYRFACYLFFYLSTIIEKIKK